MSSPFVSEDESRPVSLWLDNLYLRSSGDAEHTGTGLWLMLVHGPAQWLWATRVSTQGEGLLTFVSVAAAICAGAHLLWDGACLHLSQRLHAARHAGVSTDVDTPTLSACIGD
jgi:hypothetical protein